MKAGFVLRAKKQPEVMQTNQFFSILVHLNQLDADQNCCENDKNFSQKQNKIANGVDGENAKGICRQNTKSSLAGNAKRRSIHGDDDVSIFAQVLKEVFKARQAALTSGGHESCDWILRVFQRGLG